MIWSELVWRVVGRTGGEIATFSDIAVVSEPPKVNELFSIGLYYHHKCCLPGEPGVESSGSVLEVSLTGGGVSGGSLSEIQQ